MKKCNLNFFRHLYHKDFVSGFIKIEPFSCCGLGYDPNLVGAYFLRSFSLHSELSYALHKLNVLWEFWRLFIHNGVKFTQIFLCFNFFFQVSSDTQTPFFSTFFFICVAFFEVVETIEKIHFAFQAIVKQNCWIYFFREKLNNHILSFLAALDFFYTKIG